MDSWRKRGALGGQKKCTHSNESWILQFGRICSSNRLCSTVSQDKRLFKRCQNVTMSSSVRITLLRKDLIATHKRPPVAAGTVNPILQILVLYSNLGVGQQPASLTCTRSFCDHHAYSLTSKNPDYEKAFFFPTRRSRVCKSRGSAAFLRFPKAFPNPPP